jgi:hypothetical protein
MRVGKAASHVGDGMAWRGSVFCPFFPLVKIFETIVSKM